MKLIDMRTFLAVSLLFALASCNQDAFKSNEACEAILLEDCTCLQIYEPVCACDNKTYANACLAECSSVMTYTEGECP